MNKKVLFLDITSKCNLRCKHCYNNRYFESKEDSFDYTEFLEIIKNYKLERIHILGGEPLLSPYLFDIVEYANLKNITVSINTNGTYLDETMFRRLSAYKNIDQITVSLDGGVAADNDIIRGKGTYEKVVGNLLKCKTVKTHVQINLACVITDNNIDNIIRFKDLDVQYKCLMLSIMFNKGNACHNFKTKINGDIFFEKIVELIFEMNKRNVMVQLDMKPLAYTWLSIMLEKEVKIDYKKSKCAETKLFYSANNKLYVCNPSSFEGARYEVIDGTMPDIKKIPCSKKCMYKDMCLLCSINCDAEQFDVCEYVLEKIEQIFERIFEGEISISDTYSFIDYDMKTYFINFSTGIKYLIFNKSLIDSRRIKDIYYSCNEKDKLKFKTMITALYLSNQISIRI